MVIDANHRVNQSLYLCTATKKRKRILSNTGTLFLIVELQLTQVYLYFVVIVAVITFYLSHLTTLLVIYLKRNII